MRILLIIFMAIFAAESAVATFDFLRVEWSAFKHQHQKNYDTHAEKQSRMEIFMENKRKIVEHNRKYEAGQFSYKLAVNEFADMDHEKFVLLMNGLKNESFRNSASETYVKRFQTPANIELPSEVDWRKSGLVTPVKNQKKCGSCWAFSATGSLEGQNYLHSGKLVFLSEQNLVDCSDKYGNEGCSGGLITNAFSYVIDNDGIDTEESYPYEAEDGKCRYNPEFRDAMAHGFVEIPGKYEEQLKDAVATVGPISVGIDASAESFQFYSEGVYNEAKCSSDDLDHGVLVVGYGTEENGDEYWLVKNSWGTSWGLDGYIKMSRNRNNQCGIATNPSYPLMAVSDQIQSLRSHEDKRRANMKTLFVVFMAIFAAAQAATTVDLLRAEWSAFKHHHQKSYDNHAEEQLRMDIFMENKRKIVEHNRKYDAGQVSYKLAINKFADMHHEEFARKMNGYKRPSGELLGSEKRTFGTFMAPANVELPSQVDWRPSGAVTPVKDQGPCGSCWAFSATGSLEGQNFRKHGKLVSLSEQNLVDCTGMYGDNGCDGGFMEHAFEYIKDNRGIDTEVFYPYEAENGKCRYNPKYRGAMDAGYVAIPKGDENKLKAAVATIGPISVAIDASVETFQFYSEGVYNENECSSDDLDHGVLVVGYGTEENGEDYWLVKNSWGNYWGLDGYIKMSRNRNNQCGIATEASYPIV
ncbi:cathepsin L-like [Venturia canescens]|uniref:cathepsin L-like n=1 Tax=Venturia canescens TaxID=32260 RepID=UPI001C9CADB3|nr:cathepsin L-like [Venturia canescens]